ncbi:hypothetical protein MMC28_009766 [Mycoblastus sanguinarius]|nr:hypothetical protein [Mycoblastus sanguinarius]
MFCSALPRVEFVFQTVLATQKQNPILDKREVVLLKYYFEISLSGMRSEPIQELLKLDLELMAAMQESLKDTKYQKHMENKDSEFDAKRLIQYLGEESKQIKYWTSQV